jgi:hypothetical protein
MSEKTEEKPLINASDIVPRMVDWWRLEREGKASFHQGEPIAMDCFDLPQFDPRRVAPISGLDLCLVHLLESDSWAIAPSRENVSAWAIAAAYVRLGYVPPLAVMDRLEEHSDLVPIETRRVIQVIREEVTARQERLSRIQRLLDTVLKGLPF